MLGCISHGVILYDLEKLKMTSFLSGSLLFNIVKNQFLVVKYNLTSSGQIKKLQEETPFLNRQEVWLIHF